MFPKAIFFLAMSMFVLFWLGGCNPAVSPEPSANTSPKTEEPTVSPSPIPTQTPTKIPPSPTPTLQPPTPGSKSTFFGFTHQQADGNRFVAGKGSLPEIQPLDIPLADEARWLVAAPTERGSMWITVLRDGQVQGFRVEGKEWEEFSLPPLPAEMPPVLIVKNGKPTLLTAPVESVQASPLTPPVMVGEERIAFIELTENKNGGDIVIWEGQEIARFEISALPDARLLVDEKNRLLVLGGATTRYGHNVLGDGIEATQIILIETQEMPQLALTIPIPAPAVIEGLAPIWTDWTEDGQREIIVTLSDDTQGAQIVVFDEAGEQIATGPAIGQGFRWRHQLAVAPFGPDGTLELVDILTPHIGGTVEFYQLEGDSLQIVAQKEGFSSHQIGTRNLDMAIAGDFEGDGRIELLVPNQAQSELEAIRHTTNGRAEVVWSLPLKNGIQTNLAAVTLPPGQVAVGIGQAGQELRLWLPQNRNR